MRALVVLNHLAPAQLNVWESVADLDCDVHIAGSRNAPSSEGFALRTGRSATCESHVLEPRRWRPSADHLWWTYPGLLSLVKRLQPDVVHVVSELWGLLSQQAVRGADAPVVVHGADNVFDHGSPAEIALRRWIIRRTVTRLEGYASWNAAGLALARHYGLPPEVPGVVLPSIASLLPHQSTGPSRARPPSNRVLFVGRLTREKGLGTLLKALAQMPGAPGLVVVGDGPERKRFARQARDLEIQVQFLGSLSQSEIAQYMTNSLALIVPSETTPGWREQFGRVATEAMQFGLPVVFSSSGSLGEVVGLGGIPFVEGDAGDLAEAIGRLIEEPGFRDRCALEAESIFARRHHPTAVAQRLCKLWQEATRS